MRNEYTYKYVAFFVVYCIILVDAQKPIALFCDFSKQHGVNENFSKKYNRNKSLLKCATNPQFPPKSELFLIYYLKPL